MYIPEHRFVLMALDKFLKEKEQEANLAGRDMTSREILQAHKEFWSKVEIRTDPHKDFAPSK